MSAAGERQRPEVGKSTIFSTAIARSAFDEAA
jgi:hypothetical protein